MGKAESVRTDEYVYGKALPQVAPTTAAALKLCDANPLRRSILITNTTGSGVIWYDFKDNVTAATGAFIGGTIGSNVTLFTKGAVWAISVTATQTISIWEESYIDLGVG